MRTHAQVTHRNSAAPKTISVAFWMKRNSLPLAGYTYDPFSKIDNSTHRSTFSVMTDTFGHVGFFIGTSDKRLADFGELSRAASL